MFQYRRNTAVFAATLLLGSSLAVIASFAADTPQPSAKTSTPSTMADERLMVSNDGFQAERDVGAARIAIFQGNPDAAKTLVKGAQKDLATVAQQAPKDFPDGTPSADGKGAGDPDLIPIDGQMVVADDMVLTPDKVAKVKEADEHLKNGDTGKAMDTLKQGAIEVAFTRVLMPIKGTTTHVDAAASLLDQGKYYEANIALKAAQDLLRTDTVAFGDTAAQAARMTGLPSAAAGAAAPNTPVSGKK